MRITADDYAAAREAVAAEVSAARSRPGFAKGREFVKAYGEAVRSGLDKPQALAYAKATAAKVHDILTLPEVPKADARAFAAFKDDLKADAPEESRDAVDAFAEGLKAEAIAA